MAADAYGKIIAAEGLEVPEVLRGFHERGSGRYSGLAEVQNGNWLARLLTRILGFPPAGNAVPFSIEITPIEDEAAHIWTRHFGASVTRSCLRYNAKTGRAVESFGPATVEVTLRVQGGELHVQVLRARLFGLPLPRFLTPVSAAREFAAPDGGFGFDISGHLPGVGLLIRYQGQFDVPV